MAMNILSGRVLSANLPMRVCLTSSSSKMSSTTPSKIRKDEVTIPKAPEGTKKKESLRSFLAHIFGGSIDPADPKDGPLSPEKANFPDLVEYATGEQKLLLLAFEAGFLDPYCNLPTFREGKGTKDNPIPIESFINERIVGCVCEPSQNHIKYTTVYKDEPKRCQCGHWMKLVEAPKFWEKIPREELLTIPYFQFLEMEGKLDKVLSGEQDRENDAKLAAGGDHHHH